MTTKPSLKLSLGFLLLTLNPHLSTLSAQVPSVISYQGHVKVQSTDFTGSGQFKFALVSPGTNVSRRATATGTVTSGFLTGVTVTDGGLGYNIPPEVTITDATGSGATAMAQVSGGTVQSIIVRTAGSGYSATPTVTIALPSPSFVFGTFWSNDGTSSAGSEPAAAVSVPVQQGLFTVFLGDTNIPNMQPVPANVFTRPDLHLRIWFNDGTNGFAQLLPDQRLGSVGYAMMAAQVSDAAVNAAALADLSVTTAKLATNAVTSNQIQEGTISAPDLSPTLLDGTFWKLTGNSGTVAGHFLGAIDNRPLDLRVNNQRALRLEPTASNQTVNVVGGSALNFVAAGVVGATIGGGGSGDYGGAAYTNSVRAHFGTIAGGYLNDIAASSDGSVIGGGIDNHIAGNAGFVVFSSPYSVIGGGQANRIGTESSHSVIAGGEDNEIGVNGGVSARHSTIGGGNNNNIGVSSTYGTIAGGQDNRIGNNSDSSAIGGGGFNSIGANSIYATIPGGNNNFATNRAFAAGSNAKANHSGAFVWGDSNGTIIGSTNANSVTFRAAGGYRLFSNSGATLGAYLAPNGGSWTSISDRNAKENFVPVNPRAVLEQVAALPISTWNYKSQTNGVRHIGPMAQDFKAAFHVGESDTGITTVDADGVALAAIQGLHQLVQEKENEIAKLKSRLETLERFVQQSINSQPQGAQ